MTAQNRIKLRKEHPDSWIAVEAGDHLTGQVTDVTEAWSDVREGGSFYPLLTIEPTEATDGYEIGTEVKVHAFGAVLYNEIMRQRPELGEIITITYQGTSDKEPKKGLNPPELYKVRVHDRTDGAQRAYDRIDPTGTGRRGTQGQTQDTLGADTTDLPFS